MSSRPRKRPRFGTAIRASCANSASTACFAYTSSGSSPNSATISTGSKNKLKLRPTAISFEPSASLLTAHQAFASVSANQSGGKASMDLGLKGKVALVGGGGPGGGRGGGRGGGGGGGG